LVAAAGLSVQPFGLPVSIAGSQLSLLHKLAPSVRLFRVVTSDPTVALKLALSGFGIVILPLWMAKSPEVRRALVQILPQWVPKPITLCALFSNPSRLTPKVQVLLDFLDEYLGTDRDPRLNNDVAAGYFSDRSLTPTSGP